MIDSDGFRANVGIIISNDKAQVFWGRRLGMNAWQFPQGGIRQGETAKEAMYRELREEVGLEPDHVRILSATDDWLRYWLPRRFVRQNVYPLCVGQKQIWYLLKLVADESCVDLGCSNRPEFDLWKWVNFRHPAKEVVAFKRNVYKQAMRQLAPHLFPN